MQNHTKQSKPTRNNVTQHKAMQSNTKQCEATSRNAMHQMQSDTRQCKATRSNAEQHEGMQSNTKRCRATQNDAEQDTPTIESATKKYFRIGWRGASLDGPRKQPERVPQGTTAGNGLTITLESSQNTFRQSLIGKQFNCDLEQHVVKAVVSMAEVL